MEYCDCHLYVMCLCRINFVHLYSVCWELTWYCVCTSVLFKFNVSMVSDGACPGNVFDACAARVSKHLTLVIASGRSVSVVVVQLHTSNSCMYTEGW